MAAKKPDLAARVAQIPRGPAFQLSTTPPAMPETAAPVAAQPQERTTAQEQKPNRSVRTSKGVSLRPDLHRALKHLALDDDRPLYELMDEALIAYLRERDRLPPLFEEE